MEQIHGIKSLAQVLSPCVGLPTHLSVRTWPAKGWMALKHALKDAGNKTQPRSVLLLKREQFTDFLEVEHVLLWA